MLARCAVLLAAAAALSSVAAHGSARIQHAAPSFEGAAMGAAALGGRLGGVATHRRRAVLLLHGVKTAAAPSLPSSRRAARRRC